MERCLYTMILAPHERLEEVIVEAVTPVVREIRGAPELDSLFFVRFSEPQWQLRFRVLGEPAWVAGPVRRQLVERLDRLQAAQTIEGYSFHRYDREIDRYGGEEGMALAERLFAIDSLAVLDLIEADRRGELKKSRREFSMVLVDRMVDLASFTPEEREAFYRRGYEWATETKEWGGEDLAALERRFQTLRPGLERLFFADPPLADETRWGGPVAESIARRFLAEARPVIERIREGHRAGRIRQNLPYLFWSYAHLFSNRLGIESAGEAVLRFFMHRLLQEERKPTA